MITKFRTYEATKNTFYDYDVGEYVKIIDDYGKLGYNADLDLKIGKIDTRNVNHAENGIFEVFYLLYLIHDNKRVGVWYQDYEIERKATPEEIEEYEVKLQTIKFNL